MKKMIKTELKIKIITTLLLLCCISYIIFGCGTLCIAIKMFTIDATVHAAVFIIESIIAILLGIYGFRVFRR